MSRSPRLRAAFVPPGPLLGGDSGRPLATPLSQVLALTGHWSGGPGLPSLPAADHGTTHPPLHPAQLPPQAQLATLPLPPRRSSGLPGGSVWEGGWSPKLPLTEPPHLGPRHSLAPPFMPHRSVTHVPTHAGSIKSPGAGGGGEEGGVEAAPALWQCQPHRKAPEGPSREPATWPSGPHQAAAMPAPRLPATRVQGAPARLTFQSTVAKKGCRLISSTPSLPAPVAGTRPRVSGRRLPCGSFGHVDTLARDLPGRQLREPFRRELLGK